MDSAKSLSENSERCCGWGFWIGARRSGRNIPGAGCDVRDNEAPSQKSRRPEGFRGKGRLASLLLSRRPTKGILLRRASPSSLSHENSTSRNSQTRSKHLARRDVLRLVCDTAALRFQTGSNTATGWTRHLLIDGRKWKHACRLALPSQRVTAWLSCPALAP